MDSHINNAPATATIRFGIFWSPYHKLIDRNPEDNLIGVERQ
jgi:hypothetical protein